MAAERAAIGIDASRPQAGSDLVGVMIPTNGWDAGMGREVKAPARAKPVERFILAGELVSQVPNRDLGIPPGDALGLAPGDLMLLGGKAHAAYSDAIVEVVSIGGSWRDAHTWRPLHAIGLPDAGAAFTPTDTDPDPRAGWRLLVIRPARVTSGRRVDGARLVPDNTPKPGVPSTSERLAMWAQQADPYHDRERLVRERFERERVFRERRAAIEAQADLAEPRSAA